MSVQTTRSSAPASARSGAPSKGGNAVDPLRLLRQNLTLFIVTGVVGLVLGVLCFVVAAGFFPSFQGVVRYQLLEEIGSADVAIGKETRNEEQCQDVKRFKNRGLRPIITGNEWKRRSKKTELRFLAYVRISPNLVSNSFRLVSSFLEGMGE